jgi:hypothetical protein
MGCVLNLVFTVSCNKTKTYEELKSDERKLIAKIRNEKNMVILDTYPTDGVFGENEFVQLSSGIYLNVVDSGNGNRPAVRTTDKGGTGILIRLSGEYYYGDTTYTFNTFSNTSTPFEFEYGTAYTVVNNHASSYDAYYYFFSMGLESILSYVGDSAIVKLLVPGYSEISNYPAGSTMQNGDGSGFIPVYYDKVRYSFYSE